MKAVICEFCDKVIPDTDRVSMMYAVDIYAAEDFTATSPEEKTLLLHIPHLCIGCTVKVKDAIERIRMGSKK